MWTSHSVDRPPASSPSPGARWSPAAKLSLAASEAQSPRDHWAWNPGPEVHRRKIGTQLKYFEPQTCLSVLSGAWLIFHGGKVGTCVPFDFRQIWLRTSGYRGKWLRVVASLYVDPMISQFFSVQNEREVWLLRLCSADRTNRLTRACVMALTEVVRELSQDAKPLVIAGSAKFFSAGAELEEIAELNGPAAYEFSKMGQALMCAVEQFRAPVFAAVSGYCMGGGLDLALACHRRIAAPSAVFGHRGAALGLITGWGGTQRLPRLIGKGRALEMLVTAEKVDARKALRMGLIEAVAKDPIAEALRRIGP